MDTQTDTQTDTCPDNATRRAWGANPLITPRKPATPIRHPINEFETLFRRNRFYSVSQQLAPLIPRLKTGKFAHPQYLQLFTPALQTYLQAVPAEFELRHWRTNKGMDPYRVVFSRDLLNNHISNHSDNVVPDMSYTVAHSLAENRIKQGALVYRFQKQFDRMRKEKVPRPQLACALLDEHLHDPWWSNMAFLLELHPQGAEAMTALATIHAQWACRSAGPNQVFAALRSSHLQRWSTFTIEYYQSYETELAKHPAGVSTLHPLDLAWYTQDRTHAERRAKDPTWTYAQTLDALGFDPEGLPKTG